MAGRAAARQGDSRRRREGAPDTTRRSSDDLRGRGDVVWLRRVQSPRNLAGDAAREHAKQALVRAAGQGGKRKGRRPLSRPPLCAQTRIEPLQHLTVSTSARGRPRDGAPFDATIIRGLLVPAVVTLLGERNWYLPRRLDRVLSHEPGERPPAAAPVPQASNSLVSWPAPLRSGAGVEPTERGAATGLCLAPTPV